MFDRTFGQFVRVLIDINWVQPLRQKVLVERQGFTFFVEIDYENVPSFCSHCRMIGHLISRCNKITRHEEPDNKKEGLRNSKHKLAKKKQYVPIKDNKVKKDKAPIMVHDDGTSKNSNADKIDNTQNDNTTRPSLMVPDQENMWPFIICLII